MFERFTEEARTAVTTARQLAAERGHASIEPPHLLAALAPAGGVAGAVLCDLGVHSDQLERLLGDLEGGRGGAETFTVEFKHALDHALRSALTLGHNYIGAEHLLLGVVRTDDARLAGLLAELGLDEEAVSEAVVRRLACVHPAGV